MLPPLVVAQAAAEYGVLASLAAVFTSMLYRLEAAVGAENVPWVVGVALVVTALLFFKLRR